MIFNKNKDITIEEDYRLKYYQLKIHMAYCLIIAIILIVGLCTIHGYNNDELSKQVAFAATISGAILSVLAIIITIIGETKSENTKDKLLNISDKLDNTVMTIDDAIQRIDNSTNNFNDLINSNKEIKNSIKVLDTSFSEMALTVNKDTNVNIKDSEFYITLLETIKTKLDENASRNILSVLYYLNKKFKTQQKLIYMDEVCDDYSKMGLDSSLLDRYWQCILLFSNWNMDEKDFTEHIDEYLKNKYFYEKQKIDKFFNPNV